MATRLYPNITSVESLELLARVPFGTHARLRALEDRHPDRHKSDDAFYIWYDELQEDVDLSRLEAFESQGWGRVSGEFVKLAEAAGYQSSHGQVELSKAKDLVVALLQANGIPDIVLHHISGIRWG